MIFAATEILNPFFCLDHLKGRFEIRERSGVNVSLKARVLYLDFSSASIHTS